jgi:phospholipase C
VINFDEWGGFYDHVPPPTAAIPPATAAAGDVDGRLGFRVPAMLVSPFARNAVSHRQYDHTSVLRLIESTFGLPPLTVRDATANDLADELDLTLQRSAPPLGLPHVHYGVPCLPSGPLFSQVGGLSSLAQLYGFPQH